jgi:serine/threonine-protein kinase RsbW
MVGLDLKRATDRLDCQICDPGKPMPNARPPMGRVADPTVGRDLLPEGGFGWMLIRNLSDNIRYQRVGETNHLSLSIPIRCSGAVATRRSTI